MPHDRPVTYTHNGGPPLDDDAVAAPLDRNGWVAIARTLRDHWLVGFGKSVDPCDPQRGFCYSRGEAWLDLIMECRYAAGTVNNGGRRMVIKPGQLIGAVSFLGHRWNWTPKTVRGFLEKLENEGMIERFTPGTSDGTELGKQKGKQSQVITLCNWDIYQLVTHIEGQAKRQAKGEQGASTGQAEGAQGASKGQQYKEEQGNKGTREQESYLSEPSSDDVGARPKIRKRATYSEAFEAFWSAYPDTANNSKSQAFDAWKKLSDADRHAAAESLGRYRAYCQANPDYRCLHAERYLKFRRWEAHQGEAVSSKPMVRPPAYWWKGKEDAARRMADDKWREAIKQFANGVWPDDVLGPVPGSAECLVPSHIVAELHLIEKYGPNGTGAH